MTTDTRRKETVVRGPGFVVGGMAKGAAMLAPDMATMLAVLTTDAELEPAQATEVLRAGVVDSFNAITVDGCTSTNDTVILLASGAPGPRTSTPSGPRSPRPASTWPPRWWPTPRATRRWCASP
jgi:glutamate N-acetyltransferase / amino-acid N-acetyltransferase